MKFWLSLWGELNGGAEENIMQHITQPLIILDLIKKKSEIYDMYYSNRAGHSEVYQDKKTDEKTAWYFKCSFSSSYHQLLSEINKPFLFTSMLCYFIFPTPLN